MAGLLRVSADIALFLRLRDAIYALADDPLPPYSIGLGDVSRYLRVGEYYVAYDVDDAAHTIVVFSVWRLGDPG